MQKVRRHPTRGLRPLVSNRFQVLFTPLTGVLFTFPSRYSSLSVDIVYLALRSGLRDFTPGFTCPVLLRVPLGLIGFSATGFSPSLTRHSNASPNLFSPHIEALRPQADKSAWFGLFPFRSPLLRESILFLFLRLLRCFTSAGSLLYPYGFRIGSSLLTGFPHSEIPGSAYLRLPGAYRSLSRPSSPDVAKASTLLLVTFCYWLVLNLSPFSKSF